MIWIAKIETEEGERFGDWRDGTEIEADTFLIIQRKATIWGGGKAMMRGDWHKDGESYYRRTIDGELLLEKKPDEVAATG